MRQRISHIADYEPLIGVEAVERIREKARAVQDFRVVNFNATYYGGGVAEMLSSLTLLMNSLGIKTEWRVLQGTPDYFGITKRIHNALQGGEFDLTDLKTEIYEHVVFENAIRNHLDHDVVIIHDPQPLPLIQHYRKTSPWIWRCHLDLTNPHRQTWEYLRPFIERYDAVILSGDEYRQELTPPQLVFMPAINPFNLKNRELSAQEMDERLAHYRIPTDLPLVVQISRFDRWKDPAGVIEAFKLARREVDCTLVLLGNFADDDPEGVELYESLLEHRDERIMILPHGDDTALVNTLQRRAAVVLQKSLREGFGLTVTEAMWKGAPVIGGKVGGICRQIVDGENGFLVSSVDEAAARIVQLLRDDGLCRQMGERARATVRQHFLLSRYLEQYLDLFASIQPRFEIAYRPSATLSCEDE